LDKFWIYGLFSIVYYNKIIIKINNFRSYKWIYKDKITYFTKDEKGKPKENHIDNIPRARDIVQFNDNEILLHAESVTLMGHFLIPVLRSKDGKLIDDDLIITDLEGKTQKIIDTGYRDFDPNYSPDGKSIVFSSNRNGNWDIYIANLEKDTIRQLTFNNEYDETSPKWSPDGKYIAYISSTGMF